ncbi:hypothetical protein QUC31_016302 [Theobroma cacao]
MDAKVRSSVLSALCKMKLLLFLDIDECQDDPQKRCGDATCVNIPGHYQCERRKTWVIILGISLGFGVLCLAIGGWWLYKYLKKRRNIKLREKFFKRNGGLLLQQQVSSSEGSIEKTKIFTSKELDKATDNFNKNRAKDGEVVMVATLAYRCLSLSGRKWPTMKEAAMELERILSLQKDSNVQHDQEEIDCVKIDVTYPWDGASTSTGSVCDSGNAFSRESEPLISSKTK